MQTLALRDRAIDEIAYVEGGLVRCTTWGVPDAQTSLAPPDLKLSSGASLKLDAVPVVSAALRMVAVRDGAYSALIEPGRFTDVVLPDGVQLALVLPGVGLLGSVANPDLVLVAQALGGGTLRLEEDYLTSVARSSDLAVVMLEPLLLDEPAAGLNHEECNELGRLLRRLRDEEGLTLLLVEHHMALVMALCQRIVVLVQGEKIAQGAPDAVRANPAVIEAYLGAPDYAHA
ncbi:hypothetical protein AD428_01175 [Achromobacter sp. DMS1]|nr:hypothetical protein AD428_01175 [Achromobacter sp. DMS1]